MSRRARRSYTDEFKLQMVMLIKNGMKRQDIIRDYELTPSTLDKWLSYYQNNQSFKESDNLTDEQKEIIELKKQLKQKEMEVDILKQAALIIGKR
ncbi:MAG: transposase [Mycoplasmatales bacterium]